MSGKRTQVAANGETCRVPAGRCDPRRSGATQGAFPVTEPSRWPAEPGPPYRALVSRGPPPHAVTPPALRPRRGTRYLIAQRRPFGRFLAGLPLHPASTSRPPHQTYHQTSPALPTGLVVVVACCQLRRLSASPPVRHVAVQPRDLRAAQYPGPAAVPLRERVCMHPPAPP